MSKLIRTQGHDSAIWKTFHHHPTHSCPECQCLNTLEYVGFARAYIDGMHAKLYVCMECGAWLDCIWPSEIGSNPDLINPTPDTSRIVTRNLSNTDTFAAV
jgi:hypothetical protein